MFKISINPMIAIGLEAVTGKYTKEPQEAGNSTTTRRLEIENSDQINEDEVIKGLQFNYTVLSQTYEKIEFQIEFARNEMVS